ncbi:MAG: Glyoxalase/bleomycin resistance protein/dioxygenase [Thermoleophilia bacterium]|nr:Glyoxalase/bleomycin resistance protein/dioxygenase [Thermoleophilia bacterium]
MTHRRRQFPDGLRALDHVAIRVADRDTFAEQLLDNFEMRVIERTERFTLVGPDFEHGKITLLDADDSVTARGRQLVSLVLVELSGRPVPAPVHLENGLVVTFTSADTLGPGAESLPRHALVGVALRSANPRASVRAFADGHGMHIIADGDEVAAVEVGRGAASGSITLLREEMSATEQAPALDHVGVLVEDAEAWRATFVADGEPIDRWVEAPHSRAVFVPGPDELLIEFVEQLAPMGAT